jgi:hypothetical protein
MSVYVIRAFVKMRGELAANAAILKRLAEIDKTLVTVQVVGRASRLSGGRLALGFGNAGETPGAAGETPAPLPEQLQTLLIHDVALREIFEKLRPLLAPPPVPPKPEIGFHVKEDSVPYRVGKRAKA